MDQGPSSDLFPAYFPNKILHALLISPIRVTWPRHFVVLDSVPPTIFGHHECFSTLHLLPFLHSTQNLVLTNLNLRSSGHRDIFSWTLTQNDRYNYSFTYSNVYFIHDRILANTFVVAHLNKNNNNNKTDATNTRNYFHLGHSYPQTVVVIWITEVHHSLAGPVPFTFILLILHCSAQLPRLHTWGYLSWCN